MIVKLNGKEVVEIAERICRQCGKKFIQRGKGRKVYCSPECKEGHVNGEKSYLEKEEAEKKAKVSNLSIADINKLAREANMNYGQYVAVHNI